MKITLDKNLVEFMPDTLTEKAELERLWRTLIDCNGPALKLVPVGEYSQKADNQSAAFHIEGLNAENVASVSIRVPEDCAVICRQCNKILYLKSGDAIPVCCGKVMEIAD
ncbi:MAG: hypothetical protein FWH48_05540 [Oscillospiraceae bacterium]|nr:hypothetical protein [Oscillospiraceae bacterium]